MRGLIAVLASALLASSALADGAIAGKANVLVGALNGFWVPLDGGPSQKIFRHIDWRGSMSLASDDERFLIAYENDVMLFEEGEIEPLVTLRLDLAESGKRSFATWDGSRYLVAWTPMGGSVHISTLSRDGVLIETVSLDDVFSVAGFVANGDQVLLIDQQTFPWNAPAVFRLRAILLDDDLTVEKITSLGEFPHIDMIDWRTFQRLSSVIPFGDGFYVAWQQGALSWGWRTEETRIVGTRITADGTALDLRDGVEFDHEVVDGRTLVAGVPEAFDADLVDAGGYVVATIKRENSSAKTPLNGTFVAHDGLTLGTRQLAEVELHDDRRTHVETLRLRDGRTVAVSLVDDEAELLPLDITPPRLPRRRAVR